MSQSTGEIARELTTEQRRFGLSLYQKLMAEPSLQAVAEGVMLYKKQLVADEPHSVCALLDKRAEDVEAKLRAMFKQLPSEMSIRLTPPDMREDAIKQRLQDCVRTEKAVTQQACRLLFDDAVYVITRIIEERSQLRYAGIDIKALGDTDQLRADFNDACAIHLGLLQSLVNDLVTPSQ